MDEVDVMLNPQIHGNLYQPNAKLKNKEISDIIKFIWKNCYNKINYNMVE